MKAGWLVLVPMDHQKISQAQIPAGAVEAATRLARRLGIDRVDPGILHKSQHISIRLFPLDIVARVVSLDQAVAIERLNREIAALQHLYKKSAPVVGLANELQPGPPLRQSFGLTLCRLVSHHAAY